MGTLSYAPIMSLDGYVADATGNFDWAAPDEEVHGAVNDLMRSIGTLMLGRRMYETLAVWEHADEWPDPAPVVVDFAQIWRATDKVVHSTTLSAPTTARTRIERSLDPAAVLDLKARGNLGVGGPDLAGQALRAGLVDECHLFVAPVVVGGGTRALPDDVRLSLELVGLRRFASGFVHLHYRVASDGRSAADRSPSPSGAS